MLENEELDAVAVAVPPGIQYEIARVAIAKGLHVFAEKPLANNREQAKELVTLAQKNNCITAVDFIFPEIEEWQKVKQILDDQKYGALKHISVRWNFLSYDIKNKISSWKTDVKEGGGVLSFFFSHTLYYLEYFAGEVSTVASLFSYSEESKNGGEVGVDVLFKFKSGVSAAAHVYANDKGSNRHQLLFICEKATIVLANENSVTENFTIHICKGKTRKKLVVKKKNIPHIFEDERVRVVRKIAARFVSGCIKGIPVRPSFSDGRSVQCLIEEIRARKI